MVHRGLIPIEFDSPRALRSDDYSSDILVGRTIARTLSCPDSGQMRSVLDMFRTSKVWLFGALALVLSLAGTALAGQKDPGYLRTMDDLRLARALLQRTNEAQAANGSQDEVSLTIGYIDGAMAEIN